MLVSVLLLSGCKTDELEAQINENASAAEGAVSDAISKSEAAVAAAAKQAAADLAAAQEELEKLIADGNVANADALDAAVEAFNAAMADAEAAIADLEEITADNSEDLYDEIDALETDLITAIHDASQAVAAAAAQNLAAVKAELLAVIADGDYASSAELSAAVAEAVEGLSALIATVQKADMSYADSLKAELDTKLSAAIDDVAATAAKDLEAATAALEALIAEKAAAADVEAANADLQAQITALDAVLEALLGAENADLAELGNLKAYIANAIADAKAASDAAYIVVENWAAATEALANAVTSLAKEYYSIYRATYYAEELVALDVAYDNALVALSRSIDVAAVEANLAAAVAALDAVPTKADVIYADLTAKGATVDDVVRNEEWNDIITAAEEAIAAEAADPAVAESLEEVAALVEDFRERYDALETNETWANAINDRVDALLAALAAEQGYNAANKAEYAAIVADIAKWDAETGAANAELINRENVAKLDALYAELETAYNNAAAEVAALLDGFNGEYVYNYGEETYKAVTDANQAYTDWAADVVARGFALDGTVEAPAVAAYEIFAEGTLARAEALEVAAAEAAEIEALIAELTEELENLTVVRSRYQKTLEDINAAAKVWVDKYFVDPYAAEAVAGNANYEILDHAAVVAVGELYNEVMAEIMRLAEELKAALAEITDPNKVDIFSGIKVDAASAAYTAFTNWLADLDYEIDGLADTHTITNILASKTVEFKNLANVAISEYVKIDLVTLASGDDIEALIAWYDKYFSLDITDAESALPVEKVVLSEELVIDAETVAAAKAAVVAFNELTEAKAAETAALKAQIEAVLANKASTAIMADIEAALDAYAAWLAGTNAPEAYKSEQFKPVDDTVLDAVVDPLRLLFGEVEALEEARDALIVRIKALALDYKKLNTEALQDEAEAVLNALLADIKAFTELNNDVYCFADYDATLKSAGDTIRQARALTELNAEYEALLVKIAGLDIEENMKKRAEAALKAAEIYVIANDQDGIKLAYANFDLFFATVDAYVDALAAAGTDATKAAKVYEAYVLLANRKDMEDAAQLADELNIVAETFAAVLA